MHAYLNKLVLSALLTLPLTSNADTGLRALFDPQEVHCLVKNIYHEARGESIRGQEAVAVVTVNRAKSKKYPDTICETVYQPYQFSWTSNRHLKVRDWQAWDRAEQVAYRVLSGNHSLGYFPALYFHADYVSPSWNQSKRKLKQIGTHVFYR